MTRKAKSGTTVKAADSGARAKSRTAPKTATSKTATSKTATKSSRPVQERPAASEPSLPDANMPDPTLRDRPAPATPPADRPTGDKGGDKGQDSPIPGATERPGPVEEPVSKRPVQATAEDDFVTPPPHAAPQPHDDVKGRSGQTGEVRDHVGPRADVEPQPADGPEPADKAADAALYTLDQMRDAMTSMTSGLADLRLAGDGLRSITQAAQSATVNGWCALAEELQSLTRNAVERQTEATRALMSARSLPEAWEVQYRTVQQALESYADHVRQVNAISIHTMHQAAEPVTNGMTESLSRFWKLRAA